MNKRPQATSRLIEDNARVIITEWRFSPGAETGWHRHAHDYVVVYRTPASHLIESANGSQTLTRVEGETYFRPAGVEHNVINTSDHEVVFIETEIR